MAKRRPPDLADDHRCTRNGTNWRCHLPRLAGKSYCQKHHQFNVARSRARSKSQIPLAIPTQNPNLREIWAFYQPIGGLPSLYGRVERRIPNQSLVEVTPLIPASGDGAAVGLFRASVVIQTMEMSSFSHRVWFEVEGGGEDVYRIFPRKGEIWAVERYSWVEMMSSFGDAEGASGIVLVEEEGEGEDGGVFRRRLFEECELIRRFSMEELGMFLYRVSDARVLGCGNVEGLLLQGCMVVVEGENERQETSCHLLEAPNNSDQENVIAQKLPDPNGNINQENHTGQEVPDPKDNEGENAKSLAGMSGTGNVGAAGLTSSVVVEASSQQPETCRVD